MKNILLILLVGLMMSCGGSDESECLSTVEDKYGKGNVFSIREANFSYIAVDEDFNVFFVEAMSLKTTDITSEELLFNMKKFIEGSDTGTTNTIQ